MKKVIWLCLILLILDSFLSAKAQTAQIEIESQPGKKRPLVLVLSFQNNTSLQQYPSSAIYEEMIFKSIYSFTAPLEKIDMPPQSVLEPIEWDKNNIKTLSAQMKADVIVYGTYKVRLIKGKQVLEIGLHLWLRKIGADYLVKDYSASTDRDIFETLDKIIEDLTAVYMKIRLIQPVVTVKTSSAIRSSKSSGIVPEMQSASASSVMIEKPTKIVREVQSSSEKNSETATLSLRNFQIGTEAYEIFLNNKLLETARNNRFSSRLKLVAGQKYHIDIKYKEDGRIVYQDDLVLSPDEEKELFFTATSAIKLNPLENKEQWKSYTYYIDQTKVEENTCLSNQLSGLNYTLTIKDNQSNTVKEDTFYLTNGGNFEITPALEWKGGLHIKIYKTDETYAGVGLDYMINRYLWAGLGCGVGILPLTNAQNVITIFPSLECGYYLLGDLSYPYRMGVGAIGQAYYPFSSLANITNMTYSSSLYYGVGLFGVVEYLVFYLKPAVYYDFQWFRFQLAFGVKF